MKRRPPEFEGPFSRPLAVEDIAKSLGEVIALQATPEECAAVAAENGLPAIAMLKANLRILPEGREFHISGEVTARLTRTCVVTLDDFETALSEPVDIRFAEPPPKPSGSRRRAAPPKELVIEDGEKDPPEQTVEGYIDLGRVAAEFFALGLDPYPRKPGASLTEADGEAGVAFGQDAKESPFAALTRLKTPSRDGND